MSITKDKLSKIESLVNLGLDCKNLQKAMEIIGAGQFSIKELSEFKLYGEYVPREKEFPRSSHQRNLQILWESIDRVPLGINCEFSIPFRAIIAKNLFKKCGKGFIAYEHIFLNFPHLIEVGDNVAWNCGCIFDSKGGIVFGNNSMAAENVTIFTHKHDEDNHMHRQYNKVEIGNYVVLGSRSTLMPGVKMHDGSYAAAGSIVTHDVDSNIIVGGSPAKPIRDAQRKGKSLEECNLYFFDDKAFQ